MATIFAVHGTNSTGPMEGQQWWQRGSDFENDVREFVEAEDGALEFRPMVWDGTNSEASRRKAGRDLLGMTRELETQDRSYLLIGHSHGGSVIAHTLVEGTTRPAGLPHLSRWITVGTPFIHTRLKPRLFARLGSFGRALYASGITAAIGAVLTTSYFYYGISRGVLLTEISPPLATYLALAVSMGLFLLAIMAALLLSDYLAHRAFKHRLAAIKGKALASRWFAFNHGNDEAVGGLKSVARITWPIFNEDIAFDPLLLISAVGLSIAGLAAAIGFEQNLQMRWINTMLLAPVNSIRDLGESYWGVPPKVLRDAIDLSLAVAWISVLLIAFSLLLFPLARRVALTISAWLSRKLNHSSWHSIRRSAFGSDLRAEFAVGSSEWPEWSEAQCRDLPPELQAELSQYADEAAAASVGKLRNAIGELAFSMEHQGKMDLASK